MLRRYAAMCALAQSVLGCALFDQPPPEAPPSAGSPPLSKYAPLASLCECSIARAESELRDALAVLESGSGPSLAGEGFAACAAALTGVPTLPPPRRLPAMGGGAGFVELDAALEKQNHGWQLRIDENGKPSVLVSARHRRAKSVADSKLRVRVDELRLELAERVEPAARALKDAHLATQLCHATSLLVALEATVHRDRSHVNVIRHSANAARRGDSIAAAATGVVLEVRRAAGARATSGGSSRLAEFRALDFDGEFESDADDAERLAARLVRASRESLPDASTPRPYTNEVALPLWLAPRPTLRELCQNPPLSAADAARSGLLGLAEGDLKRVMLGARALHSNESTAHHGLEALCALLAGDDRVALARARDMVSGYSPAGALLAAIAKDP